MDVRKLATAVQDRPVVCGVVIIALIVVVIVGARTVSAETAFSINSSEATAENVQDVVASSSDVQPETIYVHVSGAVCAPGLYELPEDSRVAAAIDAAGGFTEDASVDSVNLARIVFDGEQIAVPSLEDTVTTGTTDTTSSGTGLININTATVTELDTLPGIGATTAEKIVADREQNGPFTSKEDLKRVSGIGDKKYEQLADLICV